MSLEIVNILKVLDNVPRWRNETSWKIKLIMEETSFISNFPCKIKNVFRKIEQINKELINLTLLVII